MVIDSSGNVGVGTTSPQALLHLNSASDTYFIIGTTNSTADGRIQFRNSAGTDAGGLWYNTSGNRMMFRTNSQERMRIDSSGRVGIGTTSPNSPLHILADGGSSNSAVRIRNSNTTGRTTTLQLEDYSGALADGVLKFVFPNAGSTTGSYLGLLYNSAGLYIIPGGNVGIGTTSPAEKFHVVGNTFNTGQVRANTGTAAAPNFTIDGGAGMFKPTSNVIGFSTNSTERMRIASGHPYMFLGNTGHSWGTFHAVAQIGRTGAVANYDSGANQQTIIANNTYYGGSGYTSIEATTGASYMNLIQGKVSFFTAPATTAGSAQTFTKRVEITNGGNVGIGTSSPASALSGSNTNLTIEDADGADVKLKRTAGMDLSVGVTSSNTGYLWTSGSYNILFGTAGTERMRITSGGNVGIGTTSPDALFEVENPGSDVSTDPKLRITAQTYPNIEFYSRDANSTNRNWKISSVYNSYGTLEFLRSSAANGVPNVTTLAMNSAGNIGIGTYSPGAALDIETPGNTADGTFYSTVTINNTGTSTFSGVRFDRSDVAKWRVGLKPNDTFHISNLFTDGSSSNPNDNAFVIRNNNYVGIGVETPLTDLHIKNATGSATLLIQSGSNTSSASVLFGDSIDTSRGEIEYTSTDDMVFKTNNLSEKMRIRYTGNVGIGTASPNAKLNVNMSDSGNTSAQVLQQWQHESQNTLQLNMYGGATDLVQFAAYNGEQNIAIVTEALASLSASTSKGIYIKSGGNVGIGTTSPVAKLDVEGGSLGSTSGDTATAAIIRAGRQNLVFKDTRTANGSDWNNATFKMIAQIDSTSHQSIDFVNDSNFLEHIDIRTGNQVFNTRFTYNGRVGIGTDSPAQRLHVAQNLGSGGSILQLTNLDSTYNQHLTVKFNSSKDIEFEGASGNGAIIMDPGSRGTRFQVSSADIGRFDADGLRLESGKGIKFSPHASGNILDDYEEGTWNPTIVGNSGASGQNYNIQNGYYTKIGSFVHATFDVQLGTLGTLSGTYIVLGGLPFAGLSSNLGGTVNIGYSSGLSSSIKFPIGAYISGSNIYLMETGEAANYLLIADGYLTNSSRLIGSILMYTNN